MPAQSQRCVLHILSTTTQNAKRMNVRKAFAKAVANTLIWTRWRPITSRLGVMEAGPLPTIARCSVGNATAGNRANNATGGAI